MLVTGLAHCRYKKLKKREADKNLETQGRNSGDFWIKMGKGKEPRGRVGGERQK